MKITFVGTGSAFTVGDHNFQSNMVITSQSGKHLLIDCGCDARLALYEQQLEHTDIDAVYVSHLHSDHVGGLEWLAFTKYFHEQKKRIPIYVSADLVADLWDHVLAGGLSSLHDEEARLETFFDVKPIEKGGLFRWEEIHFHLIQTVHVISNYRVMPSYGLFILYGKNKIFLTTDTQFAPSQIIDFYQEATLIFQDAETSELRSSIHATYEELKSLPPSIKSKMWLYHYNPGKLPDAKKDDFCGFVQKGQTFTFEE